MCRGPLHSDAVVLTLRDRRNGPLGGGERLHADTGQRSLPHVAQPALPHFHAPLVRMTGPVVVFTDVEQGLHHIPITVTGDYAQDQRRAHDRAETHARRQGAEGQEQEERHRDEAEKPAARAGPLDRYQVGAHGDHGSEPHTLGRAAPEKVQDERHGTDEQHRQVVRVVVLE